MKALISVLIFTTLAFQATAFADEKQDKEKQSWMDAGYNLAVLSNEVGFSVDHCKASVKNLKNCIVALDFMARLLPEPLAVQLKPLPQSAGSKFVLAPTEVLAEYFPYSSVSPEGIAIREGLHEDTDTKLSQLGDSDADNRWLNTLRDEIFELAKTIPESDQAWIASKVYNRYLNENQDPHSALILASKYEESEGENYSGIGSGVSKFKALSEVNEAYNDGVIVYPMPDSPSERAGLLEGDIVLTVDGEDVKKMDINEFVSKVKGPKGSTVHVQYHSVCGQTMKETTITRGDIFSKPDILKDSYFVSLELGSSDPATAACKKTKTDPPKDDAQALYIPIKRFDSQKMCDKWKVLLEDDLANKNSAGLIVDLRGNRGGYLNQVACMLDSVISDNDLIYDTLEVRTGPDGQFVTNNSTFSKNFNIAGSMESADIERLTGEVIERPSDNKKHWKITYNRKIVVLVDSKSASASEIFAGTIQDKQRGWVIGMKTFGKGSVQDKYYHMDPGPSNQVFKKETTALYVLASGRSPQGDGITPDFLAFPDGKVYTDEELAELPGVYEKDLYNSLQYKAPKPWTQQRPEKISEIRNCMDSPEGSLAQNYLEKIPENPGAPERLRSLNYQDAFARDVLACAEAQDDYIKAAIE